MATAIVKVAAIAAAETVRVSVRLCSSRGAQS